jgi:hypothetical protein
MYRVADLYVRDDVWNIDWFHNGKVYKRTKGLTFEKAVKALKPVKTTPLIRTTEAVTPGYKIHDGESWERPASAPLIWRAIKHACDKGQRVWSDIFGATGQWTIREEPNYKPGDERRHFFVNCLFLMPDDDGNEQETWFEIVPDDDDTLAIYRNDDHRGEWEVYDQGGKFKV